MGNEAKIHFDPLYSYAGYHNSNPETNKRLSKSKSYEDLSTICIVPCIGGIPPKIVQSWRGMMTPMNQRFIMIMVEKMEVGQAYSTTIEQILANPELSKWKYILTIEHDNAPPPDGLLKLYENMDKYDGIGGLYFTKGEAGQPMCFDDKTEVLTKSGWKYFKDVTLNDDVATLTKFGYLEYNKPTDKQVFKFKGEMIHWKGQLYDIMVTPDHGLHCSLGDKPFQRHIAKDVENHSKLSWKRDCKWEGQEIDNFEMGDYNFVKMDDWLEFLGYYISEGCCPNFKKRPNSNIVDIRQLKSDTYKLIADVTDRLNLNSSKREGRIQVKNKTLRDILKPLGKSGEKYVPEYVKNLSTRQILIFLEALWKGDGSKKNNIWENYYTKSKRLADDVQELLLKIGLAGSIGTRKNRDIYVVSVSHVNLTPRATKRSLREQYDGFVYDLTVPNHTLYVRRNGKGMWSGNCYGKPNSFPVNFIPFMPDSETVTPCRGIAMGFSLFKMEMFKDKRLPRPLFETKQEYIPGVGAQAYTQDLKFCEEAGKLGYKFAVDSRVKVGHYDYANDFMW